METENQFRASPRRSSGAKSLTIAALPTKKAPWNPPISSLMIRMAAYVSAQTWPKMVRAVRKQPDTTRNRRPRSSPSRPMAGRAAMAVTAKTLMANPTATSPPPVCSVTSREIRGRSAENDTAESSALRFRTRNGTLNRRDGSPRGGAATGVAGIVVWDIGRWPRSRSARNSMRASGFRYAMLGVMPQTPPGDFGR